GLEENLSARPETGDAELPKFGEPSHMAIPSQARSQPNREGVETRRAAPNPGFHPGHGEGIVQTANLASLLPSAVSQGGESRSRYQNPRCLTPRGGSNPSARIPSFP